MRNTSDESSQVLKSGPLFLPDRGLGWTFWKKRWFVLTQTSLAFFKRDPNVENDVNLTLGGIDIDNSWSVTVKEDKKLLTVKYSDAYNERAFTLKAETVEDLYEWKTALEKAFAQAPSVANTTEKNVKDNEPAKSTVIGSPILLDLEDDDETPSFMEDLGTHVPDIVVISGQGAGSSTSKEEILAELKEMSKTLEETIKSSTERKISVDNLINALSAQKKDEDIAEGNEDVDGNDVAGNSNPGGGNVQDFRGNH